MSKKIKLKDLLKENFSVVGGVVSQNAFSDNMSLSKIVKEKYGDVSEDRVDVKGLTTELSQFNNIGEDIFGKSNISKISEKLSWIANEAKSHTLSETEDWFDKITVNRNMKELTGLSKQFGKIAQESNSLQQRLGALYEDMGNILGRYYEIGEKHVPGHDDEDSEDRGDMDEAERMMFREEDDYKAFFKKAMKKFNVSNIEDMDDGDKKDFFNYVDRNYKAKKETD